MIETRHSPAFAITGTIVVLAIWIAGGLFLFRDLDYFRERTFRPALFGWLCFFGYFLQALPVSLLILARSSFYISGIAFLFLLTGLGAWAIWRRLPAHFQWRGWLPISSIVFLFLMPSIYANHAPPYDVPRALLDSLGDRLSLMQKNGTRIVAPAYSPNSVAEYLDPYGKIYVHGMDYLSEALASDVPLGKQLYDKRAALFFACGEQVVQHPSFIEFAAAPEEFGWKLTGKFHTGPVWWELFEPIEPYPETPASKEPTQDLNR